MEDQVISFSVSQLHALASILIGSCFIIICGSFLVFLLRRKGTRRRWTFIAICTFFLMAGLARMAKGLEGGPDTTTLKLTLDLIAAVLGIPTALLALPMLTGLSKLPSTGQLEEANIKLEEANEKLDQTNKQLMHSQQLFEGFMHRTPSLQFVKDEKLRFLYVNDAFCNVFGIKRDDVLGKTNQDWMPPSVAAELHKSDLRVLETLQPTEHIQTLDTPKGRRTWLLIKFPIWDEQFMIGAIGVDLTEQKAAEQREHQMTRLFREMVTAVSEYAIFMLDPNGYILTWNEGAQKLKGYTAQEIVGKHFSIFYPSEDLERHHPQEELRLARAHGQYQEEGWRIKKDGSRFWANVTITPVYEESEEGDKEKLLGFTKITRDMTDRRQFEKEIELQRDKALEASATKSAFVANISHEIRTPLSGILGMNELLLGTDLTPEQREFAETVQQSSQSLLTVLNDVLDLSRVETGRLELEAIPFNVSFSTQDATRLMSAAAKNKGLSLTHQIDARIPELVVGDPERVRQVLLNLVGNAVKFTQKGEVLVVAQLLSEDAETATVRFEVKDTGMGIAQEDRKRLFVPFGQLDTSSTRPHGGTGLGLTISKHLVLLMGGEIDLTSEEGKGSSFWFTIPFPKSTQKAADMSARETGVAMPTEPTALIVEDNPTLQDLTVKQLINLGIKSVLARCGAEAIEAVNGTQFDLIFMDVHLPSVDGYEAAKAIRKIEHARNRHTPIIAMTANAMLGDREKALDAGMDDYLPKPVSLDSLRLICEKWLAKNGTKRIA